MALHSDTRALMIKSPEGLAAILTRNADRIEQLAGTRPCRLFRPHAGWRSGAMYEGLRTIDHTLVGWTCSRLASVFMGSTPDRLNSRSISTSYRAKLRPNGRSASSVRVSRMLRR